MVDRVGSITDPEHARILELMKSPAYRNAKHPQNAAVSVKVKAYFDRKHSSPNPASGTARSPDPKGRGGWFK